LEKGLIGSKLRVSFLSQLFDPENSIKGAQFLARLKSAGFEISVVTTFPSYPAGKLYPEYLRQHFIKNEIINGVPVVRLPTYINRSSSIIKRSLSYLTFGFVSLLYLFFKKKPDLLYIYYPPLIGGLVGLFLKKFFRVPYIYEVQDLWPEALQAAGKIDDKMFIYRLINRLINQVYSSASAIFVQSNGFKDVLISKGVCSNKIHCIYNWTNEHDVLKENTKFSNLELFKNNKFNILYAGNFGPAQDLSNLLSAAHLIEQGNSDSPIHFWLLGGGLQSQLLKDEMSSLGLSNITFLDWVSPKKAAELQSHADALLVHLAADSIYEITVPQKLQAYMFIGKPILLCVAGEAETILRSGHFGISAKPGDPRSLAAAAIDLSNMSKMELLKLGSNGKTYYQQNMSMQEGEYKTALAIKSIKI